MQQHPSICWFRNDFRIVDNPALTAAVAAGGPVIPLFIWEEDAAGEWSPGSASRWWLHHSLSSLHSELEQCGSRLIIRRGDRFQQLEKLMQETGSRSVYWNRQYEPAAVKRDGNIKAILKEREIEVESFRGNLLYEPWEVQTKQGNPYKVFTPFWKACQTASDPPEPLQKPDRLPVPDKWPASETLQSLELEPTIDWAGGIEQTWQPGTAGAIWQLERFLNEAMGNYKESRDIPETIGTSRLSPHLHFGEISPRQIWQAVKEFTPAAQNSTTAVNIKIFLSELGWREFAHHVMYHFPHTLDAPLRDNFNDFPWQDDDKSLRAWQQGQTGYPIVDAGMRELWTTGWMHNRVRMIVGSFLTKHLLISWQAGAEWFWDTLVDADLANNTLGWQWISGCGADAAPYFRIFNPTTQGEKFDSAGNYVRRWIPELNSLPDRWIHEPWNAPADVLATAGVTLGETYPHPIVDHKQARQRALDAYGSIKNQS